MDKNINLPQEFCQEMQWILGDEYESYMESFSCQSHTALRINTLKVSLEQWEQINPFSGEKVSWTPKGWYYDGNNLSPAKHPYYYGGLYYIQEPSAMVPATLLPIEEGDKVLDLCAAPGGKATELAAKLNGSGILLANDISVSRAMALAKNIQMSGGRNCIVTAETPEKLAEKLPEYFDKILIDAPCSGEGMFRRDHSMIKDWLEKGPAFYSEIQRDILEQGYNMLSPGGMLLYSTCTFAVCEDEAMIQWFLDKHKDMSVAPVEVAEGFSQGRPDLVENGRESLKECVRIFPHKAKGEGHFAALLKKAGEKPKDLIREKREEAVYSCDRMKSSPKMSGRGQGKKERKNQNQIKGRLKGNRNYKNTNEEWQELFFDFWPNCPFAVNQMQVIKDTITLVPKGFDSNLGLRYIQRGLILGQIKNRFEPSPQLALALKPGEYSKVINYSSKDGQVIKYLKGETLTMEGSQKGIFLVCVDGFPLGWCQANGQGMLKNKYYPGWRLQ